MAYLEEVVLFELALEVAAADAEQFGGLGLNPLNRYQGFADKLSQSLRNSCWTSNWRFNSSAAST
jgi:hypothetical protein